MAEELRLFVALELPAPVLAALERIQDDLRADRSARAVRWTRPEGIHLTLKFLGETPAARLEAIQAGVRAAAGEHGPLRLRAGGLGCFPNPRAPRVIWVGLGGDLDALGALQGAVEAAIAPLGFPTERRPFSPHLTLGRVRQDASPADVRALGALVERTAIGTIGEWQAAAVSLMRSELGRDGARYTCLLSAPLAGGG